MTWVDWLILAGMVAAAGSAAWFATAYSRRVWEATPHGRNIMAGSIGVGVIAFFGALYAVTDARAAGVLEAIAWAYASVVLCHRRKLLAATRREHERERVGRDDVG